MLPLHSHSPKAPPEVAFCGKKITTKFWLQIHYTFEIITENVCIPSIPISGFLMYFHNSIIPSVTFLVLQQEKK